MASLSTSSAPPLAGAVCPHCGTTCVYEIPLELKQHGITSVEISCHGCAAVFETQLPDLPEDAPQPSVEGKAEKSPILPEVEHQLGNEASVAALELEAPIRNKPTQDIQPTSGRGRKVMLMGIILLITASVVGVGIYFMPTVDQTPLTANIVHVDTEETDPSSAAQSAAELVPAQSEQPPQPPTGPAAFDVTDSGYTISTTELGNVMNISLKIKNKGGEAGLPNSIILHLIAPDGNILMSWPVPPGREAMDPLAERRYSAQLIEPPQNIASLEVALN